MKIRPPIFFATYLLILAVTISVAILGILNTQTITRGVAYPASETVRAPMQIGVNASLEQYASDADLRRALGLIRDSGASWVRQFFYWNDIEPRAGEYRWEKWDRLVARADESGLHLVAVITTTPAWARDAGEADLLYAPPANPADYARFVAAFVRRYGRDDLTGRLYIQIWDNPNVHPFWGRRNADPIEYVALLRASARAARAANPKVKIISAGLGYSSELIRGHPDFSDVLYLRGMYDAGAQDSFDILGAKAHGMWSGPEDRRVGMEVFNFSRVILLREEMLARGDDKPVWAVEMGWNALPRDWRGAPSPWGSDAEETQSDRLQRGIARARSEWNWMPALFVQHLQPNARADDPVRGFALLDQNFQPRVAYTALKNAIAAPVVPATFDFTRFYFGIGLLAIAGALAVWRGAKYFPAVGWIDAWQGARARFVTLPQITQYAILITTAAAFYFSPNAILNFALLALLVLLFSFRLDLGLCLAVFSIPFYLLPKNLFGGAQFSMIELLTLAAVAAWGVEQVASRKWQAEGRKSQVASRKWQVAGILRLEAWSLRLESLDWAVIAFVLLGALSVKLAANFGVANREFRVMVIEPALLYLLIRFSKLQPRDLNRLAHSFILSAVAVSLIGLYQLLFTDYVIVGEGVRRVLAVYGSPNNLALYLERALVLAIALAVFAGNERRLKVAATTSQSPPARAEPTQVGFALWSKRLQSPYLFALIIALCLYFTYSRGAWLIGLPAGLLALGLMGGARARRAVIALVIVGGLALIPFLQTERAQSLFQSGTGTGFFRTSVWQSALAMIRDHPVLGVGLDNFLYEYPKYMNPDAWREPNLSHPHNIVLDFWTRLGIAGVAVLIVMVVEFFRAGARASTRLAPTRGLVIGLVASMTAALAHGMIDAAYFYVDLAFVWMMMFAMMAEVSRLDVGG
ncbi:MAG: O-antigen ligase family protein [Chloroflexi bacterium]|nr:O-antigen ligase family protein [Chloroflexota bacterium]